MRFDFNRGKENDLTFEKRFGRENTNDAGQCLNPEATKVVINEFRKFMYINAVEIAKRKRNRRKGELDPNTNKIINGEWFYECPYAASPILDKVWRCLILYCDSYKDFCKVISGGFIDRVNPVENIPDAFKRY